MEDNFAIQVQNVNKDFILPHEKNTSVKSVFTSLYKRKDKGAEVQHALRDINLTINPGEFFGIVGRNGSGKSTLLKILAGIYQPTKGTVTTRGKLVPFIELGVGFNPELTGRENVYLNGAMLGFSEKRVTKLYKDIVDFAELHDFMDQKLKNYSSGMQVRLAFACATMAEADILLIDEVLAVGDADFQRKCFNYFQKIKGSNTTVVFVTHDMNAVREYCDRAVLIDNSEIVVSGTASKVATEYSRLFSGEGRKRQNGTNRWGTEGAKISEIKLSKNKFTSEDEWVEWEMQITSRQQHESQFGFRVKNVSGTYLLGANTKMLDIKNIKLAADKSTIVLCKFQNVLSDGDYTIDLALLADNGIETYDWWDEAISFTVYREQRSPYPLMPKIIIGGKNV